MKTIGQLSRRTEKDGKRLESEPLAHAQNREQVYEEAAHTEQAMQFDLSVTDQWKQGTTGQLPQNPVKPTEQSSIETPTSKQKGSKFHKLIRLFMTVLTVLMCLTGALAYYPNIYEFLSTEKTEDAYVTGHVHQVSSRLAGTIESVLVKDNQWVREGQVLATIDPKDVQVELEKAQARVLKVQRDATAAKQVVVYAARNFSAVSQNADGSIAQAQSAITKAESGITTAEKDVVLAKQKLIEREAELHKAKLDLDRYESLAKEGAVPTERLESARKDYDVALAARDGSMEAIEQSNSRLNQAYAELRISKSQLVNARAQALQADAADAQIRVNEEQQASSQAAIREAEADVKNAKLRLGYTRIVAPVSGKVGKKTVEEGQRVQAGTPLLSVVGTDKWIVANYKETQLKNMRIGQRVKISIDAFGDREFSGHVESFSPASGASFALLPPDNATGNFTKIVQRIPVKIVFNHDCLDQFDQLISPGMSCEVKVWVH